MNNFDGYSNHCPHFLAPLTAVILGSKIIEVHITSDKSKNFADNAVSFDYDELENLIKLIRLAETIKF
jgi:N,N'-diacetyllegionaminate synthase